MKKSRPKDFPDLRESPSLSEAEIFSSLAEKRGTSLFLGRYSLNQVVATLRRRNFFKEAKKRKLWPLEFDLDSSEYPRQRLRVFFGQKKPENMIVDLKLMEGAFHPKKKMNLGISFSGYNFLILDWLTLQNPLLSFSAEKTPLPGQKYPGLGLGKKIVDIFIHLARITHKDGILIFPAYFHNALLFSRYFYFLNPEKSAEVRGIRESFPDMTFKQLGWIIHLNCMKDSRGKEYEWMAEEQIYPLNKELIDFFDSRDYRELVEKSEKDLSYKIDWECYEKKRDEIKPEVD